MERIPKKIIINTIGSSGTTISDLNSTTAKIENVEKGKKFFHKSGNLQEGEAVFDGGGGGGGAGAPVEITSEAEMTDILNSAQASDNGKIYKYVGESGIYTPNAYYQITIT